MCVCWCVLYRKITLDGKEDASIDVQNKDSSAVAKDEKKDAHHHPNTSFLWFWLLMRPFGYRHASLGR
jgi:hypothetical protein